ncbi:PTS galactosamine/N-acetylgalactosamine transporter subunit IIA [uncultured Faecalicoccus sp.]|uniref:PTS galactosamine/N-acetylgalactosamine transporter subunit IIA n=1 Tax=uncultured Faecalicoccus sp. TaxID=1971760 RepID=UPI0026173BD0|nr:PTS galactosamine/N-acetylgalactosamine transporter subunit IIA [uncultured Faecalicoccus sp.]
MIGLIVTGHGNFATGLTSSLKLIAGDPKDYAAVDFEATDSTDDLAKKLTEAMDSLSNCEGIIVLSDLAGGSPFKTSVEVGFPRGNVEVVAGTNLGMLVEINLTRTFSDNVKDLANSAVNVGKDQVIRYEFKPVEQPVDTGDGI